MIINIIRHAETEGNLNRHFVGITNQPLAEQGILTATNSPHYPEAKLVYTSNLARTIQTAQILFPNAELREIYDLREVDFGEFEGKSHEELMENPEYRKWLETKSFPQAPGGEKIEVFTGRCAKAFKEIVESEMSDSASEVNFVIHGGVIMALMHEFATPYREFFDWRVNNCKGFRLEIKDGASCLPASLRLIEEI